MEMTRETALKLAKSLTFVHFSRFDHDAFAGVRSALPMIAETEFEGKELVFVLDGNVLEISDTEGEFVTFNLFD